MTEIGRRVRDRERRRRLATGMPSAAGLLRWVYVGRVTVALVVFSAAGLSFQTVPPATILTLATTALVTLMVSGLSVWYTHVRHRPPTGDRKSVV